jgi:hypothetical protein
VTRSKTAGEAWCAGRSRDGLGAFPHESPRRPSSIAAALWFVVWLAVRVYACTRPRVDIFSSDGTLIVRRWFLTSRPADGSSGTPGWYLHHLVSPDPDDKPHNHPWRTASTRVLRGRYVESRTSDIAGMSWIERHEAGDGARLPPWIYHRILNVLPNTWTLFHAGQKHGRGWGFRGGGRRSGFVRAS